MKFSIFALAAAILLPHQPASAQLPCSRKTPLSFENPIKLELDYLICLHNEQNQRLNDQSRQFKALQKKINEADLTIKLQQLEIQRLQGYVSDLIK